MAHEFKDFVMDRTWTMGAGPFVLENSPAPGYRSFSQAYNIGATFDYHIHYDDDWEIGVGTLIDANTIDRAPTASSSGGNRVFFPAGLKTLKTYLNATTLTKVQGIVDDFSIVDGYHDSSATRKIWGKWANNLNASIYSLGTKNGSYMIGRGLNVDGTYKTVGDSLDALEKPPSTVAAPTIVGQVTVQSDDTNYILKRLKSDGVTVQTATIPWVG